jgi:hypothetical protein
LINFRTFISSCLSNCQKKLLFILILSLGLAGCESKQDKHIAGMKKIAVELRKLVPEDCKVVVDGTEICVTTPRGDSFFYATGAVWEPKSDAKSAWKMIRSGVTKSMQAHKKELATGAKAPPSKWGEQFTPKQRANLNLSDDLIKEAQKNEKAGWLEYALTSYKSAYKIRNKILGEEHPKTQEIQAMIKNANLLIADIYVKEAKKAWNNNDQKNSIKYAEEARRIRMLYLGPTHPKVLSVNKQLQQAEAVMGKIPGGN